MSSLNALSLRVLPLTIAGIVLAGCGSLTEAGQPDTLPSTSDFYAAAKKVKQPKTCITVQIVGDVTSIHGGLPWGWVTFVDDEAQAPARPTAPAWEAPIPSRENSLEQARALTSAGILSKTPTQVYSQGRLVPATRYQLTDLGAKALMPHSSNWAYKGCLAMGTWTPTSVIYLSDMHGKGVNYEIPKTNKPKPEKLTDLTDHLVSVGHLESYEASVSGIIIGAPEWGRNPEVQNVYHRDFVLMGSAYPQKVELARYKDGWVPRESLTVTGTGKVSMPLTVPAEQEDATLQSFAVKLQDIQPDSRHSGVGEYAYPLRQEFSETPKKLLDKFTGYVFFADKPDPNAYDPVGSRVKSPSDPYLTSRSELLKEMDILVAAGAYGRFTTTEGDPYFGKGVLYKPASGVRVNNYGVVVGVVKAAGPLIQEPSTMGGRASLSMRLKASYTIEQQPEWVSKAATSLPVLRHLVAGGTASAAGSDSRYDEPPRGPLAVRIVGAYLE